METFRGIKCEYGYIHRQKIFQSFMIAVFAAAGILLFLIGYLITGTRANVFTVLGILMVLPGAKRVIALIVMLPHKSVEKERYDKMKETLSEGAVLLTDYVFTSADRIMSLDFVVIGNRHVWGVSDGKRQDVSYLQDYLYQGVTGIAPDYKVKICVSEEEFYQFYKKVQPGDKEDNGNPADQEKVVSYLKVLAV